MRNTDNKSDPQFLTFRSFVENEAFAKWNKNANKKPIIE